jgi:porin
MTRPNIIPVLAFFLSFSFNARIGAEQASSSNPDAGVSWTGSTLSGDWAGVRNKLAANGVTIDMNLTQVGHGIVYGGKDTGWQYGGGRGNITVSLDSQKLGLWPGGFLTVESEGNFIPQDNLRKSVNGRSGALMPVNSSQFYPTPAGDNFNLPQLSFTQFIGPHAALLIGKLDTTSGDANEFAHGKGDTQFMNLAFNFNPVPLVTTPYSTLGTGLSLFPTGDPRQATINFLVLQANGQASRSGFDDLDANKLTFAGEARMRTNFLGLTGHQLFGASFSNRKFTSVDQSLRIIVENRELQGKKGSWNLWYNFDQYLYEPKKASGRGAGIFGRFGASDGNPNFMHFFYSLGIGGKGLILERPEDRFGFGFYYIDVKGLEFRGLLQNREFLRDEYGFEAFYNIAVTPWMFLTPDIQVVRGAQKDRLVVARGPLGIPIPVRKSIGTATILGIRLQLVF